MKNSFDIPGSKKAGIYLIYNLTKRKAYIGEAKNFHKRAYSHRRNLLANSHNNKEMQADFNNGDKFAFAILEVVEGEYNLPAMRLKERQYIYTFYCRNADMYNSETKEQVFAQLYQEMIFPTIHATRMRCKDRMGIEIAALKSYSQGALESVLHNICDFV